MSDILYTVDEWNNALESADIHEVDPLASETDGGPLAGWLSEQYTHDKVGNDAEILEAVINVLENEGHDAFSPETFFTVLLSYRGDTETYFRTLVENYMEENHGYTGSLPGNPDDDALKQWYFDNCASENETYASVASGSSLYWFDKGQW